MKQTCRSYRMEGHASVANVVSDGALEKLQLCGAKEIQGSDRFSGAKAGLTARLQIKDRGQYGKGGTIVNGATRKSLHFFLRDVKRTSNLHSDTGVIVTGLTTRTFTNLQAIHASFRRNCSRSRASGDLRGRATEQRVAVHLARLGPRHAHFEMIPAESDQPRDPVMSTLAEGGKSRSIYA